MAGQQGELLALASGYFESLDDDDARIAERTDAALGALPLQEAQFVWYVMTDDRTEVNLGDGATAERIVAEAAHEERLQFLAFCQARAQRLVWTNAPIIRRLALELLRRPALDGPAVESVLTAARKEQEPHGCVEPKAER